MSTKFIKNEIEAYVFSPTFIRLFWNYDVNAVYSNGLC